MQQTVHSSTSHAGQQRQQTKQKAGRAEQACFESKQSHETDMKGVQGVFMQAISIVALDEGHQGQQHADHGDAAEDPLVAHDLERLYVQICHEVVLKGNLGGLHALQTDSLYQHDQS